MGIRSLCGTIAPEEEEVVIATVQIEQGSHQHEARVSLAIAHWPKSHPAKQESRMTKFALYVPIEAKPGKEKEVADFLRSAVPLVNAEPGTISWYAIQEGPSSFAIFDTFDDEAGRDAHLNGKVAAALMERIRAGDMFATAPEIHKLSIIASKSAR